MNELSPDLVLLNIGTNDWLVRGKSPSQYYEELRKLIQIIHEASPMARIIICEPNAVDMNNRASEQIDNLYLYRQARINLSQEIDSCAYFDIPAQCGGYDFFEKSGYMQDRIHPNAYGKKHIAHKVFDAFFK